MSNGNFSIDQKIEQLIQQIQSTFNNIKLNPETDSLIADFKNNLIQIALVPELNAKNESLIKELKAKLAELVSEKEVTDLSQKIDTLMIEIKFKEQRAKLSKRIDNLIEATRAKVAGFPLELDREVQDELAKLIKILGIAQIEFAKDPKDPNKSKKTDFPSEKPEILYSTLFFQVKAIVDYVETAIDSLNGKPNLVLAQKLRYASEERLRKIEGGWMRVLADRRDDFVYAIKLPTKVLLGVVLAIPLTWIIVIPKWVMPKWVIGDKCINLSQNLCAVDNPVNQLLSYLPSLNTTSETNPTPSSSPTNPTPSSSSDSQWQKIAPETLNFVSLLLMTGTLGGAVSILARLRQFDNPQTQKYEDDFLPFLIGLVKPILGGSFAFFIFLLLNSAVLPIEIKVKGTTSYFYGLLALAFIAGFSERLVPDLINQAERTYAPPKSAEEGQGIPPSDLKIEPSSVQLKYAETNTFTLNPALQSDDYPIQLKSDQGDQDQKAGKIVTKTTSNFVYTAPTPEDAAGITTVTITVTSNNPPQTATATVTLTA